MMAATQPSIESRVERYRYYDGINTPYLKWQADQFLPAVGQRVLEVGCGVGSILELLGEREFIFGIDIEADVLEAARERFAGRPGYAFACADIGKASRRFLEELRRHAFDTVVTINVLEHVADDLAALQHMTDVLVPNGSVAILVPAHQALYGPYDRLDGHFRRYSKSALARLVTQAGLMLQDIHYFNSVGAIGWWLQYKLLRRTIHADDHFSLMNSLTPAMRRIEGTVRPPFGLSVVAIARKSG